MMKFKHIYTPEEKLYALGDGEWVNEPDFAEFGHNGLRCLIIRIFKYGLNKEAFGGHLCGYVQLPSEISEDESEEIFREELLDVHGGLTYYSNIQGQIGIWFGFDCGHHGDLVPSIEMCYSKIKKIQNLRKEFPVEYFLEDQYRNIKYVESECRSLADQIVAKMQLLSK